MNDLAPHEDPRRPLAERIAAIGFDYASQPQIAVHACNLCGARGRTTVADRDRYGYPVRAASCRRCGLTALDPRMTADAYARFYDGVYRPLVSAFYGRRIDARTLQTEQREYAAAVGEFLASFLGARPGARLLDVGGSTGVVAAALARRFGLRATVIDPAPAELDEARALGVETIRGLVEEWDPGGARFEVVGLFQTVDHLLDIAGTLRKVRSIIAPEGLLFMDIVDFRAACRRGGSIESAVKLDHPYSLTEETAEAFLARAGFAPLHKWHAGDGLHVAYAAGPREPDSDALPSAEAVARFFREIDAVQNAPQGSGRGGVRVLGLIPARGGSKGLPGKNVRLLAGKSLVERAHDCAVRSGALDRVILSTDSAEIAAAAGRHGLEVPFPRPPELARDETPMIDVALHALEALEGAGYRPDALLLLQPTSPLRRPEHVRQAIALLAGNDAVCTVAAVPRELCPHYLLKITPEGLLDFFMPDGALITRRQDVPQAYQRDGTIYLTRTDVLRGQRSFYGRRCMPLVLAPQDVLTIDDADDWAEAEGRLGARANP